MSANDLYDALGGVSPYPSLWDVFGSFFLSVSDSLSRTLPFVPWLRVLCVLLSL
jgi:hypothetical protein